MNREMRGANNTALETPTAAAMPIASAENRVSQVSVQKRRWGSWWRMYWCFGSYRQSKRIGPAVLGPETTAARIEVSAAESPTQSPAMVFPFVAPPSSPASFLQSEPPSITQSPASSFSLTAISANMYSPGPTNIFAIGPYAHETQLVSPPVFSTEPSTAPCTPPESVQLTTPSSPEVPFARLLDANYPNCNAVQRFPLSPYEFEPGSPVSHLILSRSAISGSGTSSPFPDHEFTPGGFDAVGARSQNSFLLDHQNSDVAPLINLSNGCRDDEPIVDYRVSFELTAEDAVRCQEVAKANDSHVGETSNDTSDETYSDEEDGQRPQTRQSPTLGSSKEFNFDNVGGNSDESNICSDWWANGNMLEKKGIFSPD